MKKFLLRGLLPAGLWLLCSLAASAQTTLSFAIDQPESPLMADAGPDLNYDGEATLSLGGTPTATGGFGEYTYAWEPAAYLDDPTAPNPVITNLDAPTTFTLTVSDPGALCEKQAEVFVDYTLSTVSRMAAEVRAFPNPFANELRFEADRSIAAISVFDISGRLVDVQRPFSPDYVLSTTALVTGFYFFQITLDNGSVKNLKLCKRN